jgi:hypothetical protein
MQRRSLGLLAMAVVLTGCRAAYPEGSDAAVANCLAAVRNLAPDAQVTEVRPGERGGWMVTGDTGHDTPSYPGEMQPWTCSAGRDGTLDGSPVFPA